MSHVDFLYYHLKEKNIIKREKYDVVISFYQFLPSYITNIKSSKHIIWLHGSVKDYFSGFVGKFKHSYSKKLDKYDHIVVIADEMKEQLIDTLPNIKSSKITRIYNPFSFQDIIDKSTDITSLLSFEEKLLEDSFICMVARIDERQKDIKTLILAYKQLFNKNLIKEKLYLLGDGVSRRALENFVKTHKLDKQVFFLGNKANPYIWIKKANLFVLSSKYEGLPTVIIEAMILGTFVVSSDCETGPKEILKNAECGDLFEVGNVEELSQKINYVLTHSKYRAQKINQASQRVLEFSENLILEDFRKMLNNL